MKRVDWKPLAVEYFEKLQPRQRVFTRDQVRRILNALRPELRIPKSLSVERFLELLTDGGRMRQIRIPPERDEAAGPDHSDRPSYRAFERYVWGEASPYEVALALRGGSYLSHGSAAFLHDLVSSEPDEIYVNKEQSTKPVARGTLTQEAIDRAFANHPRSSNYVFSYERRRIVWLQEHQVPDERRLHAQAQRRLLERQGVRVVRGNLRYA